MLTPLGDVTSGDAMSSSPAARVNIWNSGPGAGMDAVLYHWQASSASY
jgi:hypothetical protein